MGLSGEHWKQVAIQGGVGPILAVSLMITYLEKVYDPRPDPYTSIQATQGLNDLRLEMEGKLADQKKFCESRLSIVQRRAEQLGLAQSEIWRTIEALPPDAFEQRIEKMDDRIRQLEIDFSGLRRSDVRQRTEFWRGSSSIESAQVE